MTGSTDRPLRAGVVGLGMMGRNHVRVWDDLVDDVDLVAVADPDSARPRAGHRRTSRPRIRRCGADAGGGGARPRQRRGADQPSPRSNARGVPQWRQRARREADRRDPRGGAADDRGRRGRREDADRRPHRALQPGHPRAPPTAGGGRARPDLPDQRHAPRPVPGPDPRRRGRRRPRAARPRHHAVPRRLPSRFESMPRRSGASIPITRICSPARCGSRTGSSAC